MSFSVVRRNAFEIHGDGDLHDLLTDVSPFIAIGST